MECPSSVWVNPHICICHFFFFFSFPPIWTSYSFPSSVLWELQQRRCVLICRCCFGRWSWWFVSLFSRLAHTFAFVTPSLVSNLDRHPVFFQSFSHFERAPTTKACLGFAGSLDCKGKLSWRLRVVGATWQQLWWQPRELVWVYWEWVKCQWAAAAPGRQLPPPFL